MQHAGLAGADRAAAIDESLRHVPNFRDVVMGRHPAAIRQGEGDIEFRLGAEPGFEFGEVHGVVG
ncbi:hypothetical protein D3C83_243630 [compost metagenome]